MFVKIDHSLNFEELKEIFNLPNQFVAIINRDGSFYKVNESNPVLGWNPEEIISRSLSEIVHPDDAKETQDFIEGLFSGATGLVEDFRNRCIHKDGSYRWISWTAKVKNDHLYGLGIDVTEKVEYEEALTVQSLVLESISEGVVISNNKSTMVFVNSAAERLFGYETEELLGQKLHVLSGFDEEQSKLYMKKAIQAVSEKEIWMGEWEGQRKDGSRLSTACRVTALNLNGENHYVCVLRDITETKFVENEQIVLQKNFQQVSERLSLAVKASRIGIWEWRIDTNEVIWDEITEEIYGFSKGSFPRTAEAYSERVHPEDREETWKIVTQALADKNPYWFDHRIIRLDGTVRWLQGSGMAYYNNEDKPYLVMGTVLDITDRKESENDQKFLAEVSEILSSSLDFHINLQSFSDFTSKYFCDGCIVDQLLPDGKLERIIVSHSDKELREKLFKNHISSPQSYVDDHPLLNSLVTGKTVFLSDASSLEMKSAIILRLRGRESLLGTLTFFTIQGSSISFNKRHLRLAEELAYRVSMSLENSLLYLNSQEAIKSRDEFLSIASHELKTPLQSLTLQNHMRRRQLEKGQMEYFTPERIAKTMDLDNRQLIRINRLIDDMLDITRIRADRLNIHKEAFDFCHLVQEVVERFKPQLEGVGITVNMTLCKDASIKADSYRIEQVIVNMLTNAMKYGSGKPVKVEVYANSKKVTLTIQDRGPGIAEQDLERIFQRFERAVSSSEVSGLGLGLYISRQIVEQHDGSLLVTSELGRGSTFIMELPTNI